MMMSSFAEARFLMACHCHDGMDDTRVVSFRFREVNL